MTEIARYLQFNVTFKLVDDGKYGSINEHGRWNGMIKEVRIYRESPDNTNFGESKVPYKVKSCKWGTLLVLKALLFSNDQKRIIGARKMNLFTILVEL